MIQNKKSIVTIFVFSTAFLFTLTSCFNLFGSKKEEKIEKLPEGRTVTVEGMETIKGVNPPKPETSPPKNPSTPAPSPTKGTESKVASTPPRPLYSPSLPLLQMGFKKKVAILDFENNTT